MRKQLVGYVDLTTGKIEKRPIPDIIRKKFLGGRGIDMYLLYNHVKPGCDPLGPDNVVVISTGPLAGTTAPQSSRVHAGAKSPLTGFIGSTSMGGHFAPELRYAGFDHLVIKGSSAKPVYLFVNDGEIEIRDAAHLWGQDTQETQRLVREELGDEHVQTLCIGQAGENLVRFASIRTGPKCTGGRTGIGAVMGSKKLKAVASRGTLGIEIAHPEKALELMAEKTRKILASKASRAIQEYGTMVTFSTSNAAGQIRVRNFETNTFDNPEELEPEHMHDYHTIAMGACFACPIHCHHKHIVPEGPKAGTYTEGPEYTTLGAFGTELDCHRLATVLRGNEVANRYGFDTLEFGSMCAWAMELYEKGLINDDTTGGLKLEWGNEEAIFELVEQVVFRKGFGDIIAEGPKRAIAKLGEKTRYYNINVKGMSNLHSDERSMPGFALGIGASTRGADHLRSRPVIDLFNLPSDVLKNLYGFDVTNDYTVYKDKGRIVWWFETYYPLADCLGICRVGTITFSPNRLGFEDYAEYLRVITGWEFTPAELQQVGERVYTLERMFNIREGATRQDDSLPDRYFTEPTPAGLAKNRGKKLDREQYERMLDENYEMHGWDKNGVPRPETLKRLGLDQEPSHII
ncbi:MAG: aldehyde ferredoxin oxidoreductase family protein [Chloroflexi bacterium]|nr:aldehyde ferredoxin oxidoreductase family protein [Chloroflexota bacterium]